MTWREETSAWSCVAIQRANKKQQLNDYATGPLSNKNEESTKNKYQRKNISSNYYYKIKKEQIEKSLKKKYENLTRGFTNFFKERDSD